MPQFHVEDDVAEAIWQLANPKPFENLSFDAALRRVIGCFAQVVPSNNSLEVVFPYATPRRALTPNAKHWAANIQELKNVQSVSSWKSICDYLEIRTAGDSARRKLQKWVEENRPVGQKYLILSP